MSFSETKFIEFLENLKLNQEKLWIASLIDILKYETEAKSATIENISNTNDKTSFQLIVATDYLLYDQELTVVIDDDFESDQIRIFQNNTQLKINKNPSAGSFYFNVEPITSSIYINYTSTH